ncbi:MAG TPA: phosphodiester glycosidase family protein [Candidatus Deferrimicrobium sp.]|nr:phosphodiester glycosidase family protein [Candidatus Deferrimicrobium sp.]
MLKKLISFILFQVFFAAIVGPFLLFWGPFDTIKAIAVGSIVTSRHPQVASIFLSQAEIDSILNKNEELQAAMPTGADVERKKVVSADGIVIEDIRGNNGTSFKGKVMLIKDPSRVIVANTNAIGESGERVSDMVKEFNAVAGINAGGFNDPNGKGNGGFPQGITMSQGKVVYNDSGNSRQMIIGMDDKGKLVIDNLSLSEMQARGIRDAVSFFPQLVKDGKGLVKGDGGWGVAPRTGIGQKADGTIIFVVIDGRQLQSLGATLKDLQKVFLDYGAVTAANLDGGSSTTMVYNGQVINKPADIFGERYVPTTFVVKP